MARQTTEPLLFILVSREVVLQALQRLRMVTKHGVAGHASEVVAAEVIYGARGVYPPKYPIKLWSGLPS